MSWNYRVLQTQDPDGTVVWAVHEVYYDADGSVRDWTTDPTHPVGESWAELHRSLSLYAQALLVPPLDVTRGAAVELTITGRLKRPESRRRRAGQAKSASGRAR